MRGDIIARRLGARITESSATLTVHYPPDRPAAAPPAAGVLAGAAPVSPLTGRAPATSAFGSVTGIPTAPPPAPPSQPPITLRCLWEDAVGLGARPDARVRAEQLGWSDEAHALARVLAADALVDPARPDLGTVFGGALHVEHDGKFYRVLDCVPVGPGFRDALSYAVWVGGASKQ